MPKTATPGVGTADIARHFIDCDSEVKRLNAELDEAKQAKARAEEAVLGAFEREGVQQIRVDGQLVSIRRDLWASPSEGAAEDLAIALDHLGLGDLCQYRVLPQTLSAYVRERERLGEEIPTALAPLINVSEKFSARVTKRG